VKKLIGAVVVLAAIGGIFYAVHACNLKAQLYDPGTVESRALARTATGKTVLVIADEVDFDDEPSRWRLDAIDLATGESLARVPTGGDVHCHAAATAGKLWCYSNWDRELVLRDVATLDVVSSQDTLLAGAPPLAKQDSPTFDAAGNVWLATADGRFWSVGGKLADDRGKDDRPETRTTGSLYDKHPAYRFEGGPRQHLMRDDKPFAPGFEVLHGEFLPFDVDGVLVVHAATVDQDSPRSLTAVAPDGTRRWTAALDGREVQDARLVDGAIIVGMPEAIIAVDLESGRVRWRHAT
jgi:outer membrane protein assembly factor BamB